MKDTLTRYLAALADADAAEAVDALIAAVDDGTPVRQLLREVLSAGQVHVGQQWFTGVWTVADEHAATAVAEQALAVLAPPPRRSPDATRAVMACAEGEWHTMPARLAVELARDPLLDVVVLGANVPADHLARHLISRDADLLLLSVTMPTNLIAASRSVAAAREAGLPVVVGGAAWGTGQRRAHALGADWHCEDATGLRAALPELQNCMVAAPAPVPVEALLLDAPPHELLLLALERQCAANAWMQSMTTFQRNRSLEDLGWIARHTAAAVACDDPQIVGDLLRWLVALLGPRGVPLDALLDSPLYLADALSRESPAAVALLRGQVQLVRAEVTV